MNPFLLLFAVISVLLLTVPQIVGEEIRFEVTRADRWKELFDRSSGWIAGDGIYSFGIDGQRQQGSAGEESVTLFSFGDSLIGGVNPDGSYQSGLVMVNHCFTSLVGNQPDSRKMQFLYKIDEEGKPANLFERHYWLQDSVVIDSIIYTVGVVVDPRTWEMEGPWMLETPIRDNQPCFEETQTQSVELFHKKDKFEVFFGVGICDQGDDIYVYGFRDKKGEPFYPRQLVVARAPRLSYSDISTWRFWDGTGWSSDIADSNRDEAALAHGISNELSVTQMIGGSLDGRFVLVYTEGCLGPKLNFAVADSPYSVFSGPTTFYHCPEPEEYKEEIVRSCGPDAAVVTYNAKAHPRLSLPGELLVSYNLNVFGIKEGIIFSDKKYLFPSFVLLKLP